jgi:very-short-patch-repair endonuclease
MVRVPAWLASPQRLWHAARMRQTRRATLRARQLRRTMTEAEAKLWSRLRNGRLLGMKFRRQVPIGSFIADFCCRNPKLVVEVDGGQHAERAAQDASRSRVIAEHGYTVLRFWDHDVLTDTEAVLAAIAREVTRRTLAPSPNPLPR